MDVRTCVFVANDAGEFAFRKMLEEKMIDVVITITEDKARKLGVSNYLDVKRYVGSSVEVYYAKKYSLKDQEDVEKLKSLGCEMGFVLGWNRLISKEILEIFKRGVYGFHGTPFGLPKGRGRSPTIWTLVLGYDRFFLHMFRLTEGVDDGNIIDTQKIDVLETDDIRIFHMKTAYWSWKMIERSFERIANGYEGTPQVGTPIYFRKRTERDGMIRWKLPARMIYNLVRAITRPYPGAWTIYRGMKVRVWRARIFDEDMRCAENPGTICESFPDGGILVSAGRGSLILEDLEPILDVNVRDRFEGG